MIRFGLLLKFNCKIKSIHFSNKLIHYLFSICNSLIIYDQNPCATQVIFPSFFAPQRPTFLTKQIPLLNNFSSEQSSKQNPRSIHLILIVRLNYFK